LAEVGSEASDAESPRFEDVISGGAAQKAFSRAGKALLKEEKEEEDPNTHFKQKQKEPESKELTRKEPTQKEPRKKKVVKKARRDTKKVSTAVESESVAEVPPLLIILVRKGLRGAWSGSR